MTDFCRISCAIRMRAFYQLIVAGLAACLAVADVMANSPSLLERYTETIRPSDVKFEMLPIPGGKFTMGSPTNEHARKAEEGPQHEVEISPFWMGKCEVTWDEFEIFMLQSDLKLQKDEKRQAIPQDKVADALARPSAPYVDMTFGMGRTGFPAVAMSHYAARSYCQWLSAKTGRYYRLPTEAEWEYACRAGTTSAYSFGNDVSKLGEFAWYAENSESAYQKVGLKKPNAWGLRDMHGNVREWCLDQFKKSTYLKAEASNVNPISLPTNSYPCVVRGGSWDDDANQLRSAARCPSSADWHRSDPSVPPSAWYECDAPFCGFRIVRPLVEPTDEEINEIWDVGITKSRVTGRAVGSGQ